MKNRPSSGKVILLVLAVLFIFSCGEKKTEQPVVKEPEVPKVDTLTEYFPPKYEEEVTDTVLDEAGRLRLVLKRYTQMESSVVQSFDEGKNLVRKYVYRDNALSIRLTKGKMVLVDTVMTKHSIAGAEARDFPQQAVLHEVAFENYDSNRKVVLISCMLSVPESDWESHFFIHLDRQGRIDIQVDDIE